MSKYIEEYKFGKTPREIKYYDNEPLKLSQEFRFYHNKNKIKVELINLQNLFQDKLKVPLMAPGIRTSYLKDEYSENNFIIIFTSPDTVHKADQIFESITKELEAGCYYITTTSEYMILIAKDMKNLKLGIDIMYEILKQTLDDYIVQKEYEDYIKIRPFELYGCL